MLTMLVGLWLEWIAYSRVSTFFLQFEKWNSVNISALSYFIIPWKGFFVGWTRKKLQNIKLNPFDISLVFLFCPFSSWTKRYWNNDVLAPMLLQREHQFLLLFFWCCCFNECNYSYLLFASFSSLFYLLTNT